MGYIMRNGIAYGAYGVSELSDLDDVTISSATDGQVLTYDSTTDTWVNETHSSGDMQASVYDDDDTVANAGGIVDYVGSVLPDITVKADKVSSATSGNFAGLDSNGNLTDSGHKHSDYLTSHQDISGKADKVSSPTNGDFAGLDSNGNLTDSGKKASDFCSVTAYDPNGTVATAGGIVAYIDDTITDALTASY